MVIETDRLILCVEGGGTVRSNNWHTCLGVTVFGVMWAILAFGGSSAIAASCESLTSLSQPNTTVTLAQSVPAGGFTLPGPNESPAAGVSPYSKLPSFCRVAATLRTSR